MLVFEQAGLATSIQDGGRTGVRHLGVPASGAADPLSLALANWLTGKAPDAAAIEFTLTGGTVRFGASMAIALAGADAECTINGEPVERHIQLRVEPGDLLEIGMAKAGCRLYLGISAELQGETIFGSMSTYATGGFGGYEGRILRDRDEVGAVTGQMPVPMPGRRAVDHKYLPFLSSGWVLRAVPGPEAGLLDEASRDGLFTGRFRATQRASRQGVELGGVPMEIRDAGQMLSSAVFPGTVQCPPSGNPYLLMADAQTTGGYPRIAQVIRADRHLMGQIKPGDTVRFIETTPEEAAEILHEKNSLYAELFGGDIF